MTTEPAGLTDFDDWLAAELSPPTRAADEAFVSAMLARVDEMAAARRQLAAERAAFRATRRRLIADALAQCVAMAALVVGLLVLSRLPELARYAPASGMLAPPLVLVLLLWAFASGLFDPLREWREAA